MSIYPCSLPYSVEQFQFPHYFPGFCVVVVVVVVVVIVVVVVVVVFVVVVVACSALLTFRRLNVNYS